MQSTLKYINFIIYEIYVGLENKNTLNIYKTFLTSTYFILIWWLQIKEKIAPDSLPPLQYFWEMKKTK